jgi:SHS2 domain-containing protein
MAERYRFLDDITSDVMYEAYGRDLKELFENAAHALFSVICEIDKVQAVHEKEIEVKAENASELMINFLSELIASVDIDEMFYSEFDVIEIDEKRLKCVCRGEEIRPELGGTVVKAVTYHKYDFSKTDSGYKTRVCFDI